MDRSKFIPVRPEDLLPRLLEEREDDDTFAATATLLHHTLRQASDARAQELRSNYAPFDPDAVAVSLREGNEEELLAALDEVLEEANFELLDAQAIHDAFDERSLFPLLAEVDLDEYDVFRMYRRSTSIRTEKIRSWRTLWKWKDHEVEMFNRLVIVFRLKDNALTGMDALEAGKVYLKSFMNVPKADIEMVLPNTRLRMRGVDRALIGVPLIGGIGYTLFNSIGIFLAILGGAAAFSFDDPRIRALGGVLLVVGGYLWKSHSKIKTTRLRYMKTLSEGLYFRNLANNSAVIDQVINMADMEEAKEALLAYHFLSIAARTAEELDAAAEAWIKGVTGTEVDFDVSDGLACLQDLGLVHNKHGALHAVAPKKAAKVLDARWDALFQT